MDSSPVHTPQGSPGKWIVIALVTLGLASAVSAVAYHYLQGNRAVQYWGVEAAQLIDRAPDVELRPAGAPQDQAIKLGAARGLSNLRRALVLTTSFDWSADPPPDAQWEYAIVLRGERGEVELLLDLEHALIAARGGRPPVVLRPHVINEWRSFIAEQLAR